MGPARLRPQPARRARTGRSCAARGRRRRRRRAPARAERPPDEIVARIAANAAFWMEHELLAYPAFPVDLDAVEARADAVVPAGGRDSREAGAMPWLPVPALAARLGRDLATLPGGHLGYRTHPASFAAELAALLPPA